jgi:hypothetical protein
VTYLRSFRLPEEVRAPMQEEAQRRGMSVNQLAARLIQEGLGQPLPEEVSPPVATEEPKPVEKPGKAPPKKKQSRARAEKPLVECRHGIADCRICKTGRWAA